MVRMERIANKHQTLIHFFCKYFYLEIGWPQCIVTYLLHDHCTNFHLNFFHNLLSDHADR